MEVIKRGAEAVLYRDGDRVVKVRVKKGYRHPLLDERIRRYRTRREARLLSKARAIGINAPRVIEVDEERYTVVMEYIEGVQLKKALNRQSLHLMEEAGRMVGALHRYNLVHGDLTTSNFILKDRELYLIDFGLGEVSTSIEDKAVDLVCFKKSYFATHSDIPEGWELFLRGYTSAFPDAEKVLRRMEEVERRARYL